MQRPVEEFVARPDEQRDAVVVGTPLHETAEDLLDRFRSTPLDTYLTREASEGCGNYLLADWTDEELRLVTAPGYVGGYVATAEGETTVTTTLVEALRSVPDESLAFRGGVLRHYLRSDVGNRLPLRTPVAGVDRVPPGSVVTVDETGITDSESYLYRRTRRPTSFPEAMGDALSTLADRDVGLLYSGGVDSTAMLCLLSSLTDESFPVVAVDTGPNANHPEQARRVADHLGVDVDVHDLTWPVTDPARLDAIQVRLETDFTDPVGDPSHALTAADVDATYFLSGQNVDSMLTVSMHRPQLTLGQYVRATKRPDKLLMMLAYNVPYTDAYLRNTLLRRSYLGTAATLFDPTYPSDASDLGYLAGLLSTGAPNYVADVDRPTVTEETGRLLGHVGETDLRRLVHAFTYHTYATNMNKVYGRVGHDGDASVVLPAVWGPMVARYLGGPQSVVDAVDPKREVYRFVRETTGHRYQDLAFESLDQRTRMLAAEAEFDDGVGSPVLDRNADLLTPEESLVLAHLDDGDVREYVTGTYDHLRAGVDGTLPMQAIRRAHRAVNLEAVLRASRRPSGATP